MQSGGCQYIHCVAKLAVSFRQFVMLPAMQLLRVVSIDFSCSPVHPAPPSGGGGGGGTPILQDAAHAMKVSALSRSLPPFAVHGKSLPCLTIKALLG